MAPSRKRGGGKAAAVAAACRQWKVGDLVLAKVKGFPAWPAAVSEPEKWGYTTDWKKVLVHFFGTQQIAFCNPADVEAFTEEKKQSLLTKRHAKGSDFVRALKEIIESYEKLKQQEKTGDPKSADEATLGDAGNTTLLPQVSGSTTATSLDTLVNSDPSHGRDESILLNEDASAAEQMLALRGNSVPRNRACGSAVVKEPRKIAIYSTRRRNGGSRSQKCAPQNKLCPVQISKSSVSLRSDKLQSSILQYSDAGQNIDDVENGAFRRRKRIRRSPGLSESGDVASSALSSHGSDEENASGTATVESDNSTRNEGHGVDSGSRVEHSDTGGLFIEGDYELRKGLNFQINTLVKRKKRKPTRKRGTSDVVDPPAKVEAEAVLGACACDNNQTSQNFDGRLSETLCKTNGDEHLPLVKRARVRMSREYNVDHEANVSVPVEELSSKETLISGTAQTSPSDVVSSHDTSSAGEPKIFEVSAKPSGSMVNEILSAVEKPSKETLISGTAQTSPSDIVSSHDTSAAGEPKIFEVSAKPSGSMVNEVPFAVEKPSKETLISGTAQTSPPDIIASHDTSAAEEPKIFQVSAEPSGSMVNEVPSAVEKPSKETLISGTAQTSLSDIVSSHDTSAAGECKIFEVSANPSGSMVNEVPSAVQKPSDSISPSEDCVQTFGDKEYAMELNELSKAPDDDAVRPQSNQVSSSSVDEAQTTCVPEAVCSGDSHPVKLPIESDLPAVECLHPVSETETPLDPNTVDSSGNKTSGLCSSGSPQLSGQHRSQDQDACDSLENIRESLNELGKIDDAHVSQIVQSEPLEHSLSSCLMVNEQETKNIQKDENMQKDENKLLKEEHGSLSVEYDNVKSTQTTANPPISGAESDMIVDESEPLKEIEYSKCENAVENSSQLELSGEVDYQKQQVQTNSVSVSENLSREKMSLSPANIADTPARWTPNSNSVYHIPTAESANDMQNNNSCSPTVQSGEKKAVCDVTVKEEEKINTGVCQGQKVVSSDAQSIRESFEDALSSLVRTKESIGRATRFAMDLMKFGVSTKAMEILAHTLESESNLQRRVDLFFLVDSIAQCSKGLKGDAGCVYLSAIQVILPRLLAAAVPAGATTQENRRQCLKVLRLWLERRILPESLVRHHIRELESHSIVPACLYSRRSARTERSLDDPVRDMEGMLVDEYGSNSTLQLPGFCMPAMLKEEDEESDSDEEDFEPVTPEHESRIREENVSSSTAERHTLILEDVDGELEMEDVAPPWETGNGIHTNKADTTTKAINCHQHVTLSYPPLPSSSPPPPPPQPAHPSQQAQCAMSDSYSNGFDSNGYPNMHGDHQRMNPPLPGNTMHYQGPESSYSSEEQLTNSMSQADGSNFQHRPYPSHPHPPPPPSQHQYSYTESAHHMKSRRDGPSYSQRSHYVPNFDERNYHDNHERMRHAPYESRDGWRHPSSSSYGSRYQDKHKGGPYPSSSYNGGPPRESGRYQNHRWNHPPRPYNNRHSFHPKPHCEGSVPVGMRDPGMWHQRGD